MLMPHKSALCEHFIIALNGNKSNTHSTMRSESDVFVIKIFIVVCVYIVAMYYNISGSGWRSAMKYSHARKKG